MNRGVRQGLYMFSLNLRSCFPQQVLMITVIVISVGTDISAWGAKEKLSRPNVILILTDDKY